ncbi:hypothetical protein [Capnocytophaga gingivalis]|jgi:hypothetical protein|uniref:hypothetical protein n=1 Tax=Capnocytophaga gingivalis TaxID=1017 RepID=UPI0023F04E40|nr:hypothetical protein [Capnocytophaga gingivalis]
MKKFKYITMAALAIVSLLSCSKKDDDKPTPPVPPTPPTQLKTVAETKVDTYTVRLQNTSGTFVMGYNDVTLSVTDASGKEVDLQAATFTPWMEMYKGDGKGGFSKEIMHTHTCPHTALAKEGNVWKSQVLFQMMTAPSGVWFGKVTFKVGGKEHKTDRLDFTVVEQTNKALGKVRNFRVFTEGGNSKGQKHIYAVIAPEHPKVGENDLVLGIWKMQSMESFPEVEGLTVGVAVKDAAGKELSTTTLSYKDKFYRGKVTYPKAGTYILAYTLKDAQGNLVQPKDDKKVDTTIATEIQF